MENFNEIITSRRSIRKFTDEEISDETIHEIIRSALYAPSACNSQCFYFIAVKNKEIIEKIALETQKGVEKFYADCNDPEYIKIKKKQVSFFGKAPLVIFVYMTDMKYYDNRSVEYYKNKGFDDKEMSKMLGSYDILSVGAAVENILLTIHSKGLGACWMNEPTMFSDRISALLHADPAYRLLSVIPVGKPAYEPRPKSSKTLDDILQII